MKVSGVATLLFLASGASSAQVAENSPLIVQSVECRGNRSTSCEFIRSHLNLAAGMPVDESEIRNAQLRLSSLRNFDAVDVRLQRGAQRDAAVVVIEVTENSPVTTESLAGVSSRLDATRGVLAGRAAHQNLFGRGETLDLSVVAAVPFAGAASSEDYEFHLRYADPNLFGSENHFGVARASWINTRHRDIHGNFSDFEGPEFDLRVGRRFGDFSYFAVGVTYRPADWVIGKWNSTGANFDVTVRDEAGLNLIYGWNSEDDLYFPTRGSSFHIIAGVGDLGSASQANPLPVQFRKTWRLSDSLLTVKLGGSPSPEYRTSFEENQWLALNYARPLQAGDSLKRGRWYIEPGISGGGYTARGERIYEVGIKAGVRLDTTAFGIVDLYLLGTRDPR